MTRTAEIPAHGGRWIRDPETGALSPQTDDPEAPEATTDNQPAAGGSDKRKGKS